jgi:hypothetical protein
MNNQLQAGNPAYGRLTSVEKGQSPSGSFTLKEQHHCIEELQLT